MDGAKSVTDTTGNYSNIVCGRLAYGVGRSLCVSISGPRCNENPGESRIIAV